MQQLKISYNRSLMNTLSGAFIMIQNGLSSTVIHNPSFFVRFLNTLLAIDFIYFIYLFTCLSIYLIICLFIYYSLDGAFLNS